MSTDEKRPCSASAFPNDERPHAEGKLIAAYPLRGAAPSEAEAMVMIGSNAIRDILAELARARAKFPRPQASAHEGYAVLAEEVDELWDEVKGNHPERNARMRAEAIQVAAMALRFIEEVCDR